MRTNGLDKRIEGGALCAACRTPRPFDELLAFARCDELEQGNPRIAYLCRPSVSDMRVALCTSRVLGSVEVHAITLATTVERIRRRDAHRPERARASMPAHVRQYAEAVPA